MKSEDRRDRARGGEVTEARLASLESEELRLRDELLAAREELEELRQERARFEGRLAELEDENRRFSEQCARVQQETSNLASLYVASHRLHGTVDRAEVLGAIQEIVATLIGCEELAVFQLGAEGRALSLVAWSGIDPSRYRAIPLGSGVIGQTALQREVRVLEPEDRAEAPPEERELSVCIPLRLGERAIGAIALFRLLPQKAGIESPDRELFDLLATHAATALYTSGLHERSKARASHSAACS